MMFPIRPTHRKEGGGVLIAAVAHPMRAHALRCLLWLGAVPRHAAVIVGDVGGLHSLRHAAASPPRARGVGLVRMEAAPFPQGDELPPQCGDPLGRRPETAMTPVMQSSIEKGTFGGGSGGTATLDDTDFSVNTILKQLESIQQGTPKNIVILGTRHCSFLHQQIIELLSYALVLSDNHIFTSGATGTHAATIRGALRADNPDLLTVILPQTLGRQPREIRELLGQVKNVVQLGHDQLPLDAASRICNSELLSKGDQLIVFAFHDSNTLRETIEEAKAMSLLVTVLFLD